MYVYHAWFNIHFSLNELFIRKRTNAIIQPRPLSITSHLPFGGQIYIFVLENTIHIARPLATLYKIICEFLYELVITI